MCILSCKCNKYSNLFPKNTIKFLPTGEHFQALLFPEAALFFVGEHFGVFCSPRGGVIKKESGTESLTLFQLYADSIVF